MIANLHRAVAAARELSASAAAAARAAPLGQRGNEARRRARRMVQTVEDALWHGLGGARVASEDIARAREGSYRAERAADAEKRAAFAARVRRARERNAAEAARVVAEEAAARAAAKEAARRNLSKGKAAIRAKGYAAVTALEKCETRAAL